MALDEFQATGAFQTAFRDAPIGIALVDERGRITLANATFARISGFEADGLVGRSMSDMIENDRRDEVAVNCTRLADDECSSFAATLRLRRADRSTAWVALTISPDADARRQTFVYQVQDISEGRSIAGRLEHLIDHDFLTGLFNRRRFEQELDLQIARQRRSSPPAAILMLDLDGFKEVNDQFGHVVGDELLRGLSVALRERCRETDVLARLSGDEFAILLPGTDRQQAEIVAADVIALVRRHRAALGSRIAQVTASVGVALFDDLDATQLVALVDAAMYAAKEAGGDRYVVFTAVDKTAASRSVGEANRLRRALRDDRFVLHCQPVWDLAAGRVVQHELLIRMRGDAPGQLVPPATFLYAAERFGLIVDIDTWVVSQAVALIAEQQRRGNEIVLAVNLSGRSIGDPGLTAHIDRELDDSGIDPASLVFELTETAAISNLDSAQHFGRQIHQRGCRLALDDFGSGCASFHYLKSLPFDYIKIDGGFIRDLPRQPIDRLVVRAIVTIARGMGKQTIAEFVTDQATCDLLREEGVDHAQGFHVGRPQPANEVFSHVM
jgi:diguanylate cyclase (GGDEF)-like protein/PAS domain S-box-containing protein